jgi:hypothetical protein
VTTSIVYWIHKINFPYIGKNWNFLFYCSNIAKSENAMLWRMLSRLETCIVYSCIWSVTLAKSIIPRKTWRKLWHEFITRQTCKICDYKVDYMCPTKTSKSPHAFAMCSIRTDLLKQENEKIDSLRRSVLIECALSEPISSSCQFSRFPAWGDRFW